MRPADRNPYQSPRGEEPVRDQRPTSHKILDAALILLAVGLILASAGWAGYIAALSYGGR